MSAHSRFGFSSFARRAACPASATREDGIADTPSAAAELGSLLHDYAAKVLDDEITIEKVRELVGARSAQQVEIYTDHVRERHLEIGGHLSIEQRFRIPLHEELWGTADAVISNAPVLEVIDLKTGGGYEVKERDDEGRVNVQLAGYMLGALYATPGRFSKLAITIVQPRRGGIKRTEVTWPELIDLSADLVETIERALSPDPPAIPGEHCLFCRAKSTCAEYAERGLIAARTAFAQPIPAGYAD